MHDTGGGTRRELLDRGDGYGRAALGFFAAMAFGQDSALVAQGKKIFNDHGCYGCP